MSCPFYYSSTGCYKAQIDPVFAVKNKSDLSYCPSAYGQIYF
jgi:hypothetical protein